MKKFKISIPRPEMGPLKGGLLKASQVAASLAPQRSMLALEVASEQLFGALVSCKAGRYTVQEFVALDRANPGDDLPDPQNIKEIMERLDYQGGPAVLVTPLARAVQISMNRARAAKLSNYKLAEAARWEIEPFTGISGSQALVGVEKSAMAEDDDLLAAMAGDDEDIEVNVCAIEQNVFRALKQLFKKAGLKLARLYPPDVCFYMALRAGHAQEASQAVLDMGHDYANFALLKASQPRQINTYPTGREVVRDLLAGEELADALDNLRFMLSQVPGPLPLVITGPGAIDPQVVAFLDQECAYGAQPLVLQRQAKLTEAGHDRENAIYACVVGAAIRELMGGKGQSIGISDLVPLGPKLRKSVYLMPLAATVLLALFLLGHYGYMKNQKQRYKAQATELAEKVKKKKSGHAAYDKAKNEVARLRGAINLTKRKIKFVRGGSDDSLRHLNQVLSALTTLPDEITLDGMEQKPEGFMLFGSSQSLEILGDFALALQGYDWCQAVEIQTIEGQGNGPLTFNITLNTIETSS